MAVAPAAGVGRVFTTTVSKLFGSSYGYGVDKSMGGIMSGIPPEARGKLIPPDMPCGAFYSDAPFRKTFPKVGRTTLAHASNQEEQYRHALRESRCRRCMQKDVHCMDSPR